ncbi:hypothetical protein AMQ84_19255 [Paenibacillus riograndensis]|uniref:Lipoprotein n=1 Tax=Paenibacillus riograndensis TaxID=483937 RepID=A0A132TV31_9BACL|nr:hypothetical protein [Paenibacillus riograndensis]KWX74996.1 hypothetical protein AMQ84_19255 [Paenibacillus riograndensis]KWX86803.1 hypothetical protein AMQ83_16870 [Paenibacillus riograndensis]
MSAKWVWRIWLGILIIAVTGGCSSVLDAQNEGNNGGAGNAGPAFSVRVGDSELAGSSGGQISEAYKAGMPLIELLKKSGVATFADDGSSLLTVNKVSLSPEWIWGIQLNGKRILDWNSGVDRSDSILIAAEPKAAGAEQQPVIFTVNGGSEQPEMTHSYVLPYSEDLSVRGVLKSSGMVLLAEDNKTVISIMDYKPLSNEAWTLKVNGKQLLDSGIDMKLRPQDTLEVALVLR